MKLSLLCTQWLYCVVYYSFSPWLRMHFSGLIQTVYANTKLVFINHPQLFFADRNDNPLILTGAAKVGGLRLSSPNCSRRLALFIKHTRGFGY